MPWNRYPERMMRLLIPSGFAEEPEPCKYLPTAISKEMTQRTSAGVVESLYVNCSPRIEIHQSLTK